MIARILHKIGRWRRGRREAKALAFVGTLCEAAPNNVSDLSHIAQRWAQKQKELLMSIESVLKVAEQNRAILNDLTNQVGTISTNLTALAAKVGSGTASTGGTTTTDPAVTQALTDLQTQLTALGAKVDAVAANVVEVLADVQDEDAAPAVPAAAASGAPTT